MSPTEGQPETPEFAEVSDTDQPPAKHLDLADLREITVSLSAELGRCKMLVREILELHPGSIVTLDKQAGEMTELRVNNVRLAKGEVVPIGDMLHVRIGEVYGLDDHGGG